MFLERGLPYMLKSPNRKLTHTFVHFVIILQSRFYTLAPISVFYVDIYSSSLRLFKIDLVVINYQQPIDNILNYRVVFAVTLASHYIGFKYLDCEKTAGLRSVNSSDLNSACLKVLVPIKIFQI